MLSDLLDMVGLAVIVAGVFVLLGLGACLLAAGAALMFTARAVDDAAANRALSRILTRAGRAVRAPMRLAAHVRARRGVKTQAA